MTVEFAEKCAWRAIYVYREIGDGQLQQLFHLGIDPTAGRGPVVFGGMILRPRSRWAWLFRWRLPVISWRLVVRSGYARPVVWLYRAQQWFFCRLDGRYGWGAR